MFQLCDASQNLDNQYYPMDLMIDSNSLSKISNTCENAQDANTSNKFNKISNQESLNSYAMSVTPTDQHNIEILNNSFHGIQCQGMTKKTGNLTALSL